VCIRDQFHDEAAAQWNPLVVFCRFHEDLNTVHRVSAELGIPSCELSGRVNDLANFQEPGGPPILAAQLKAGGLGVDLTRARVQCYYSLDYSLGDYMQTRARILRPGQAFPVTYVHLVGRDTIDETIMAALTRREEVVRYVIDTMRGA